jgi:cysteinyl-tRNA synthetase
MAKSLGNFYTVPDVIAKGYTGREIRYALMRVHYRTQLNFTWEGMKEARESLGRIDDWLERLREAAGRDAALRRPQTSQRDVPPDFEEALDDDLNISAALGFLFETIRETNRAMDENKLDTKTAAGWLNWWEQINETLDFESGVAELPEEVKQLAEARMQARLAKDFRKSDELRDKLNALGWEARDTKDGQKITRRAGAK